MYSNRIIAYWGTIRVSTTKKVTEQNNQIQAGKPSVTASGLLLIYFCLSIKFLCCFHETNWMAAQLFIFFSTLNSFWEGDADKFCKKAMS